MVEVNRELISKTEEFLKETFENSEFMRVCSVANLVKCHLPKKQEKVDSMLNSLLELNDMKFGTKTAESIWKEHIAYYISFYEKLKRQLEYSTDVR